MNQARIGQLISDDEFTKLMLKNPFISYTTPVCNLTIKQLQDIGFVLQPKRGPVDTLNTLLKRAECRDLDIF